MILAFIILLEAQPTIDGGRALKSLQDTYATVGILCAATIILAWALYKIILRYLNKLEKETEDSQLIKDQNALLRSMDESLKEVKNKILNK